MFRETAGVICLVAIIFSAPTVQSRQARCSGTFNTGGKTLPASLDIYSLHLTPDRFSASATVMVRLKTGPGFSIEKIIGLGGIILRVGGSEVLLSCQSRIVESIAALDGVLRCTVSRKPYPQMDSVRAQCRIDPVQGGATSGGFPVTYTGNGVITGILDSEFDTRHPAFLDSNGQTRFFALWDQNDSTGRKNNRFGYGTIENRSELLADSTFGLGEEGQVHGTHTASTMAGSFSPDGYTGAAPDGILIGVRYTGTNEIAEGLT
ncbi:MAG: S8 family serine peptidase, partial [Chitinispirillaceae bacterium]|nr:S8 family serine peptidase [Chitinispirillaceae bacterium]